MKFKITLTVVFALIISITMFQSCSQQTLEEKIIEKAKADLNSKLKSPDTYKSFGFRIVTLYGPANEGKYFSGALEKAYMQKEFDLLAGDTIWAGRFFVYHTYQASNSFGAIEKETVELNYDGHLNLLDISKWNVKEEARLERLLEQNGQTLELIK